MYCAPSQWRKKVYKEMLENIVREPFFVLLLSMTFINIIFIAKVIAGRNRIIFFRAASTYQNDLTTFIPVENEFQIEPGSKQLQQEEKRLRQDSVSFKSDNITRVVNDGKQMQGCNYCLAFYNVGTAICPNCGSLLNLNLQFDNVKALWHLRVRAQTIS